MKNKICLVLLVFLFQNAFAQVSIEPMIGFKAFDMSEYRFGGSCSAEKYQFDESFNKKHFAYGLNLGFHLNKNISINFNGTYSKRIESVCDRGIAGQNDLKFRNYTIIFFPKYQMKNFILGIGLNTNILKNFQRGHAYRDYWNEAKHQDNHNQYGWIASAGYEFKSILLEFRYSDSRFRGKEIWHRYERSEAFELILAYRFKIKNLFKKRGGKDKCPKF